ncbi:MAG: glycoside hydrolase family 108 protein [Rhodocyclaceae bacterium]|nr:glycoside hydrolase family 108 protein [Rhodocyclaceae bacterium]
MMTFEKAFAKLIDHEGGYVNNPRDPGGETKFGISKRAYPTLNIADLTLDDAKAIYKRDYWGRAQCDRLHPDVAFQVFDGAVNSGMGNSIRWLQEAAGVAVDGIVGPLTLRKVGDMDTGIIIARYNGVRLKFMASLSTWDVFGRGWARRIAANLMEA